MLPYQSLPQTSTGDIFGHAAKATLPAEGIQDGIEGTWGCADGDLGSIAEGRDPHKGGLVGVRTSRSAPSLRNLNLEAESVLPD